MDVMFGVPAGWRRVVICDSPAQGLRTRCAATSAWASSAAAASPAGPAHPEEVAPYITVAVFRSVVTLPLSVTPSSWLPVT